MAASQAATPRTADESVAVAGQPRLIVVPLTLAEANRYVAWFHRHNGSLPSAKLAVGVIDADRRVRGVALAGRPKARMLDDGFTIEINRVCTDGTPNACSALYGACVRAAKALGYSRVVTYTLASEPGVSLRAAGFIVVAQVSGESWNRRESSKGNRAYGDSHDTSDKVRWEIRWQRSAEPLVWPDGLVADPPASLFDEQPASAEGAPEGAKK